MSADVDRTDRGSFRALREEVAALHAFLPRYQLVAWTAGNISARVPGEDLFVIKKGVAVGDKIVLEGVDLVRDGEKLK